MKMFGAEALAASILANLVSRQIAKWLDKGELRQAFNNALENSLQELLDVGYPAKTYGALDESLFLDEVAAKELWVKLLDPACDEEINYSILTKRLSEIYQGK